MVPVLGGMQQVMQAGTGRGLVTAPGVPPGLRVYGKTGTADSIGIEEEKPWGVEVGTYGKPHSWFVSLSEPVKVAPTPCAPTVGRRLAVAVVIPRGGLGSLGAGPAAMEIIQAAYKLGLYGPMAEPEAATPASPTSPAPSAHPSSAPSPSPSSSPR
jgi:cell division protein FtsI/penicillin-binding protein 2